MVKIKGIIKNMTSESPNTFKILTLGESEVGKTSILRRFVENKFLKNHLATIGIDYRTKIIKVYGRDIRLKIWDTAGQERYHNITNHIFKGADGIVLIFDVTQESSFIKINDWIEQIKSNISQEEICLILLGNKCDIEERMVSKEKGKEMADSLNVDYYETSALNGTGINEAFEALSKLIVKKKAILNGEGRTFSLATENSKKRKKGCC
jgi:small GTP-binding protein